MTGLSLLLLFVRDHMWTVLHVFRIRNRVSNVRGSEYFCMDPLGLKVQPSMLLACLTTIDIKVNDTIRFGGNRALSYLNVSACV